MKKLALLLDDITIINFGLIFKLGIRYSLHFFLAVALFFVLYLKYFYTQPIIFSTIVPMKVSNRQALTMDASATGKLNIDNTVSLSELQANFSSFAFNKTFAEYIVKDMEFSKMDFGSIVTGKHWRGYEIEASCGNSKECIVKNVAGLLGGMYTVDQGLTDDRYALTINSLNYETTLKLSTLIIKAIDQNRIESRRYLVDKEILSIEDLIKETRSFLQQQGGFQRIEEEDKNAQIITELKERMHTLQSALSNETANATALEARMVENRKIVESSFSSEGINKIRRRDDEKRIVEIRHNILILMSIKEEKRSESDKNILAQLQNELSGLEAKNQGDNIRSLSLRDSFSDDQKSKENDIKFDTIVSKNKVANLKADYEAIKQQVNALQKDKTNRESNVSKLKQELDFLKTLEAKQISLKVTNSTMTSDLQFEDFSKSVNTFRRSSSVKIALFSFCLTFLVYMFTLIVRYVMDDRIYSEEDVSIYLKDLEFYGEVPTFD